MEHAPIPDSRAEREPQLPENAFDLDKLGPDRIAALFEGFGKMFEAAKPDNQEMKKRSGELIGMLGKDIEKLVEREPVKAIKLFWALVDRDDPWVREAAMDNIAQPFAKQYGDNCDPEVRGPLVRRWVGLLHDDNNAVREAARHTLPGSVKPQWVDEATAAILDEELVAQGWRWHS